jgi:serine protease DegQ
VLGSFVFTSSGELAGLVMSHGGGLAIVPGATVLAEADRLLGMVPSPPGALGIEVQDLTPPVASVTGALAGVVVTWTDPGGPAKGQLTAGDVIEAVDGVALASRQAWDVRVARLEAGETLALRVRRRGEPREVRLTAAASVPRSDPRSLGLALRARAKIGVDVVRVEPGSAAERAGLTTGDVITLVGDLPAPTPAQVMRSFAAVGQGQRVLVAVTRGGAHFVTTLER